MLPRIGTRLVFVIAIVAATPYASAAMELRLDYRILSNGNTEVDIVNLERQPVEVTGATINSGEKPTCLLAPVVSDFGRQLSRSDLFTNDELRTFPDQHPVARLTIIYGDFVTAVVPRDCGKVLVFTVETASGNATFNFVD